MRTASEKYGTSVMKDNEVEMFLEVCLTNGSTPEQAIEDCEIVDTLLHAMKLQTVCGALTRRTAAGHLRKDSTLYKTIDSIITGAVNGNFR